MGVKQTVAKKTCVSASQKKNCAPAARENPATERARKILFVASECQPFVGTGGLGDVMGSLPKAVAKNPAFDVRVAVPLYSEIHKNFRSQMKFLGSVTVALSWRKQYCGVFLYESDGVKYYFVDNEYYFKRNGIYGQFDDGERFAFFSKSIFEIFGLIDFVPDVLHCNDWQTALVPVYLKTVYRQDARFKNLRTVFTVHNIEYQGKYSAGILGDVFGIAPAFQSILEYDGLINLMKGAIQCCDRVTTVSESYANEILSPYHSHGLFYILRDNREKLRGILNGIDFERFDPSTDAALFAQYDAEHLAGKARDKAELQKMLNLPEAPEIPVIAMISRLVPHKGIDLVKEAIEEILRMRVQFIVLGKGDSIFENFFLDVQKTYSEKMRVLIAFHQDLSRKIYAGADLFLMPSRSEPCGLAQMIASRYGTVPVVRETGGLRDSIRDVGCEGGGNGFTFADYNAADLLNRICGALSAYENRDYWQSLVKKIMKIDFSWSKSAQEYEKMYRELA